MIFGENERPAHPTGRAVRPSRFQSNLIAGSGGLMPNSASDSASMQRRCHNVLHADTSMQQHQPRRQGRRHFDPHHFTNLSEDAKREEGRYGRAHVISEQQKRAAAYYATKQSSVDQPPGKECNLYLKSYYYTPLSKADRMSPPPKAPATDLYPNAQSTSFQLAEARLRRLKLTHPQYEEEVDKVLQEQQGYYDIVQTEEKLSRKAAVVDYAAQSDTRMQQIEAATRYHGEPNLGSPAPSIERSVPYALDDSRGRRDTQLGSNSHVRLYSQRNRSSSPTKPPVKPHDRRAYDGVVPYDSADVSKDHYPSPPPIGVRQGLFAKPTMVHIDERRRRQCGDDVDTLAMKRARAKSGASQSQERQPDFIFGPGQTLQQPSRPTLAQRTEARWKAQERNTTERRTGKALYPQSYQLTSLW